VAALHMNVDVSPLSECDAIRTGWLHWRPADVPAFGGRWVLLASQMGGGKREVTGILTSRVMTDLDTA